MHNSLYGSDSSSDHFVRSQKGASSLTDNVTSEHNRNFRVMTDSADFGVTLSESESLLTTYWLCDLGQITSPLHLHFGRMKVTITRPSFFGKVSVRLKGANVSKALTQRLYKARCYFNCYLAISQVTLPKGKRLQSILAAPFNSVLHHVAKLTDLKICN